MATILVIDDDQPSREYLKTLLGYRGLRVIEVTNGAEGLAQIRAEKPDLLIADILMPTMDGFELARRTRTDSTIAYTNIIFWTAAYREQEARNLAQRCGVSQMLRKPSDPQEVLKIVSESLGLSAPPLVPPAIAGFDRDHLRLLTDKLSRKVAEREAVGLRLWTLIDISRELAAEHDIYRVLDHVCQAALEILGTSYAVVAIQDEAGEALRHLRHYRICGVSAELAAHVTPPSPPHGVISTLLTEGRPLRRHNPGGDPQMLGFPADHPAVYSFLGTPIASTRRLHGWLGVGNKLGDDEFSDADERLATALAAQVAVASESALRYDAIQRHAKELEQCVQERTAELQCSNTELEQFAYVASHDLQEPLRKVVGYTQLLGNAIRASLTPRLMSSSPMPLMAAGRMQLLIQDLLTYSPLGRLQKELSPIDCETLLQQVVHTLQPMIEAQGALVTHDPLPTVTADHGQFVQLFQNLIGNAIKFHGEQPPHIHVGVARRDHAWVFSVRDNSIGIEPQHADRIFRMFQRLQSREAFPGTGIGLAICQKIVRHHGGRIWVESQPGQGATFHFTIPEATHGASQVPSTSGDREL